MQAYMALIKTITPRMTESAGLVLQAYYRAQRAADYRNAARTTMRLLQSMIRLAQGEEALIINYLLLTTRNDTRALYLTPHSLHA